MAKKKNSNNKQPAPERKQTVIQEIVIRQPQRTTSDVAFWRNALRSADSGRVKALYDLYEDLLIDTTLFSAWGKRIKAITNAELIFQTEDKKPNEEVNALMETLSWETLLTGIMNHESYGRMGVECTFTDGFKAEIIPPKHINLVRQEILINDSDETGIPYTEDPHLIVLGHKRDFGLFLRAAPYAIWKRGGFGDYAQWLEIFGMPQRVGKYSSFDPQSRVILEKALETAGSAPWCVIPKETDVETVNNTGSGSSGSSFNEFRQACNEELLITTTGNTLTTIAGTKGARSLGEVHKEVEEALNKSDMRFVEKVLNTYFVPLLEMKGFNVKGGKFVFPAAAEPLSVSDIVSLSDIIDIPENWVREKFAIPAPKKGDQVARKRSYTSVEEIKVKEEDPDGKKKPDKETKVEKKEKEELSDDRNFFLKFLDKVFPYAPTIRSGAISGERLTLSDDLTGRIIDRITGGESLFDPELFAYFYQDFIRALDREEKAELADFDYSYDYENDAFRTAQELNLFHFSAAKTLAEVQELNRLFRESKSYHEFYKKAEQVVDKFNKTWQKTEYETAILISEAHDNYYRLIAKTKLFPYWEYKTAGDDKVRPEHEALDGVILPANDPRWKKIFPPNGWKCRCYVVPRMAHEVKDIDFDEMRSRVDEYFETSDWKMAEAQGFGVNRALTSEVFTEDQMYIKKFPNKASKLLKDVNYRTYDLGSYEKNRTKTKELFKEYEGTAADYFKNMKSENGKVFFTDYNKRSVLFDEDKYLKGHSLKKYEVRTKLLTAVEETLKTPDEVWINDNSIYRNKFNQYVFVKYYTDKTIVVTASIDEGKVYRVKTWFEVEEKARGLNLKYRWGLLIKQNPDR